MTLQLLRIDPVTQPAAPTQPQHPAAHPVRRWNPLSLFLIVIAWAVLQLGGLFSPRPARRRRLRLHRDRP